MQELACRKTHVIACDLDDSLVATQSRSARERRASDEALGRIGALITGLRTQGVPVYFGSATGRTFASIQALAQERPAFKKIFEMMDFHIAAVGTALYKRRRGTASFTRVQDWPQARQWDRAALARNLAEHPHLTLQEPEAQDEYKLSFRTTTPQDNSEHAAELRTRISTVGTQSDVIVSGHGNWRFVDILPKGVNKGSALQQLPGRLDSVPHSNRFNTLSSSVCRVVAGDSMNDQPALAVADVSIIPGNVQPDLLRWARSHQTPGSLYVEREDCAMGVLQGLQRHLFGSP